MTEKWEQRAIHMNFKKAVITFLITCLVLMISIPWALYGNFHDRIAAWEQVRERDRESEKDSRESERDSGKNDESHRGRIEQERDSGEREEIHLEEIYRYFQLSWGDLALLTGCAGAGTALGIWYWILGLIWAYRKAHRMGLNGRLAAAAALLFNLAAVAALYLYGLLKGTCINCGRVRRGDEKFCGRCGAPLRKECPYCRQEMDASSVYCSNCGKKLDENEGTEK